jgi:hypothetical protein
MNKEDRMALRAIYEALEEQRAALEDLAGDLDGRACDLMDYFPNHIHLDKLTEEYEALYDIHYDLETIIQTLEEVL